MLHPEKLLTCPQIFLFGKASISSRALPTLLQLKSAILGVFYLHEVSIALKCHYSDPEGVDFNGRRADYFLAISIKMYNLRSRDQHQLQAQQPLPFRTKQHARVIAGESPLVTGVKPVIKIDRHSLSEIETRELLGKNCSLEDLKIYDQLTNIGAQLKTLQTKLDDKFLTPDLFSRRLELIAADVAFLRKEVSNGSKTRNVKGLQVHFPTSPLAYNSYTTFASGAVENRLDGAMDSPDSPYLGGPESAGSITPTSTGHVTEEGYDSDSDDIVTFKTEEADEPMDITFEQEYLTEEGPMEEDEEEMPVVIEALGLKEKQVKIGGYYVSLAEYEASIEEEKDRMEYFY